MMPSNKNVLGYAASGVAFFSAYFIAVFTTRGYIFDWINYCDAGKGAVYSFDPVGSYQRDTYKAGGSASAMLQPLLDNQVKPTNSRKWVKVFSNPFFFF